MDGIEQRWLRRASLVAAIGVALALVAAIATVAAVDFLDLFGVRERLFVRRDSDYPYAFYHLFGEGRPVEWLQWLLLALAAVAAGMVAGRLHADGEGPRAWGVALLGLGFAGLLIEDAGNPRHVAAWTIEGAAGPVAGLVAELAVLGAVSLLAVAGLVAAWPVVRQVRAARAALLGGYGTYVVAGLMSVTSDLWYQRAGRAVLEGMMGGRMLQAPADWEPGLRTWLFMDSFVEESLELVAAGSLAVAALVLLRAVATPRVAQEPLPTGPGRPGR